MNAAEKLEAAIAKLDYLRVAMTPWQFEVDETHEGYRYLGALTIVDSVAPDAIAPADAELIVTLHRTIDAQLGLLRDAAARIKADTTRTPEIHYRHQLFLADAILEEES